LTFAVAILDAPATAAAGPAAPPTVPKPASPDDVSGDDIDSWLVGPNSVAAADQTTAVYGGDTITISAFKDAGAPAAAPAKPATPPSASDDEYERQPDEEEESQESFDQIDEDEDSDDEEAAAVADAPEEFIDESNPFYAAKKAQQLQAKQGPAGPAKSKFNDTSDAAGDILRRLMERRRAEKNS
jgi:hypothetical protein